MPNTTRLKKRQIKYAGERWRAFKTNLRKNFITNTRQNNPVELYPFLDQETWDVFVQSRRDPSFEVNLFDFSLNLCNFINLCNLIVFYL